MDVVVGTHVDVREMSRKYPQRLVVVGGPQASGAIVARRREVVPVRRPTHVPHRELVPAEHNQAGPAL